MSGFRVYATHPTNSELLHIWLGTRFINRPPGSLGLHSIHGEKKEGEALSSGDRSERTGARTRRRASCRTDRHREKEEAREAQAYSGQAAGIGVNPTRTSVEVTLVEGRRNGDIRVHRHIAGVARERGTARSPAAEGMPGDGSGRKSHRRSARKRRGTCGSTTDARRSANDGAICAPRHTYRQIKCGAALWAALTGWSIHGNRRRIAYHIISAVLHGSENVRDPAVGVRGDDSPARYANHLRIVRLPGYLVGNVNIPRRMDITAVRFEVKEERGIDSGKGAARWLDRDPFQLPVPRAAVQAEQPNAHAREGEDADPLAE